MEEEDDGFLTGLEHIKSVETDDGNIEIESDNYFIQPFISKDLTNTEWDRFIKNVKSLVRSSVEYKKFISYLKDCEEMGICTFFSDITDEDASIEVHHTPLTIHDIIEIITDHLIIKNGGTTSLLVCHEVLKAHMLGLVGTVSLSETVHQLVHAGRINININQIHGNIKEFLTKYKDGVNDEHLNKIKLMIEISKLPAHEDGLFERKKYSSNDILDCNLSFDSIQTALLEASIEASKKRMTDEDT